MADTKIQAKLTLGSNLKTSLSIPSQPSLVIRDKGVQGVQGSQGDIGLTGPRGYGIHYTWSSTQLGIKTEDQLNYVFTDLKGEKGDILEFSQLTEAQKQELRGDVGDTSINYTNIFLDSLLS